MHRICFTAIRYHGYDLLAFHDSRDSQSKSAAGYIIDTREPTFSHLLPATRFVQFYDFDLHGISKVSYWGVVKGNMTIFTNSDETQVNGVFLEQLGISSAVCLRIRRIPYNVVKGIGLKAPRFGFLTIIGS